MLHNFYTHYTFSKTVEADYPTAHTASSDKKRDDIMESDRQMKYLQNILKSEKNDGPPSTAVVTYKVGANLGGEQGPNYLELGRP